MDIDNNNQLTEALSLFFYGYKTFTKEPDDILQKHKIHRMHHRIIFFIARFPGLSINELLTLLEISKQALHKPLKELIEKGLVKCVTCKTDLRVKNLFLTAAGHELEEELSNIQKCHLQEIFSQLGEEYEIAWMNFMKILSSSRPGYKLWEEKITNNNLL